jgi:hypothetical protein
MQVLNWDEMGHVIVGLSQESDWNRAIQSRIKETPNIEVEILNFAVHEIFKDEKPIVEEFPEGVNLESVGKSKNARKKKNRKERLKAASKAKFAEQHPLSQWTPEQLGKLLDPEERTFDDKPKILQPEMAELSLSDLDDSGFSLSSENQFRMRLYDHSSQRFDERFMHKIFPSGSIPEDQKELEKAKLDFAIGIMNHPDRYTRPLIPLGDFDAGEWRDATTLLIDGKLAMIVHDPINEKIVPKKKHPVVKIHSAYWVNESYVARRQYHDGRAKLSKKSAV